MNEFLSSEPFNDAITKLRIVDKDLNQIETNKINDIKTKLLETNSNINSDDLELAINSDNDLIEIRSNKELFANSKIKIEDNIVKIKKIKKQAEKNFRKKKVFSTWKNLIEIKKIQNSTKKISNEIEEKAHKYIDTIQQINNSLWNYRNIGKEIDDIFEEWKNWKNIPNELVEAIIEKESNIKKLNENLEQSLIERKSKEAIKYFYEYRKEQYNILTFANHANSFYNSVFIKAPSSMSKMINYHQKISNTLNNQLTYLNFDTYLENANNKLKDSIDSFCKFNIEETKKNIKEYFNILININTSLKNEVSANMFMQSIKNEMLDYYYNNLSEKFLEIKNESHNAIAIDSMYFDWINDELNKLEQLLLDIKNLKSNIEKDKKNNDISYVSKQYKYKIYMYNIKSFMETYFKIKNEIHIFYMEGLNVRLKYNRMKSLFLTICSSVKQNNINIDSDGEKLIKKIERKKLHIDKNIIEKNNENFESDIMEFQYLVADLIKTVGKQILITKIYFDMNKSISYKRSEDEELNIMMLQNEKIFLSGRYWYALEKLVSKIIEVNN